MKKQFLLTLLLSTCFTSAFAYREIKPMTDAEIRGYILQGFLRSYEGECPCPFSKEKLTQKECGDQSEYFRNPGKVLCYPRDVADTEVKFYRQKHMITDPRADPRGQLNFGIGEQPDNNPNYDNSNPAQSPY